MPKRLTIPLLLDLVLVDDPAQMQELNAHPDVSRELSGAGGLIHRLLRNRIYGTLTVGAEPLPAFASREEPGRAERQEALERRLTRRAVDLRPYAAQINILGQYAAGVPLNVEIGVVVQQIVGSLFIPTYKATPDSYRAARLIAAWPSANPLKALWWRWSGQLEQSKKMIWDCAADDPQCVHATAIAMHNIVDALGKMRSLAGDPATRRSLSPAQAVTRSLVAPPRLLRSCVREIRVPYLARPLRPGTLILFRLGRMHERAADTDLALSRGAWSQCPAHILVPGLLEEVWTAATRGSASAAAARARRRAWRPSLVARLAVLAFRSLNRVVAWHRLPRFLALANLVALRIRLRARNLYDASTEPALPSTPWEPRFHHCRTADGTFNDLDEPAMGGAGSRFGRNVPVEAAWPDAPRLLDPSPRMVSRQLLTREKFIPATSLNLLAAAWIQFEVHDWFSHGPNEQSDPFEIPLESSDDWPERPMRILRTRRDPTRSRADTGLPPTHVNAVTHWWDASQLYGSDLATQRRVRSGVDGKLSIKADRLLPFDPATGIEITGFSDNWWVGLSLLHTLLTLEHNAICDRLRAASPAWTDEQLFQTARLVNAALIAKIHTIEWTPAILAHPAVVTGMHGNWWGLLGESWAKLLGRASDSEALSGIPGSPTDHHSAAYAITEEFVSVYRMHPLLPDELTFHSASDDRARDTRDLIRLQGVHTRKVLEDFTMPDIAYSFGIANPGALTLHNYPRALQRLQPINGPLLDLAAVDILRDRERGVVRYNDFRRRLGLRPIGSFTELTDNLRWARELREVYGDDPERLDLMVGLFAEKRPEGFGFSDTAFRIFILMASRRLKSDRFFTRDYTPAVYTQAGLDWISGNTMKSVLLRHYPALAPALQRVANVFAPWDRIR